MTDILGLDSLLAQMIAAVGLALIIGNGLAWWKHRRGQAPPEAGGVFRQGRVRFLVGVGALMVTWGVASLLS